MPTLTKPLTAAIENAAQAICGQHDGFPPAKVAELITAHVQPALLATLDEKDRSIEFLKDGGRLSDASAAAYIAIANDEAESLRVELQRANERAGDVVELLENCQNAFQSLPEDCLGHQPEQDYSYRDELLGNIASMLRVLEAKE